MIERFSFVIPPPPDVRCKPQFMFQKFESNSPQPYLTHQSCGFKGALYPSLHPWSAHCPSPQNTLWKVNKTQNKASKSTAPGCARKHKPLSNQSPTTSALSEIIHMHLCKSREQCNIIVWPRVMSIITRSWQGPRYGGVVVCVFMHSCGPYWRRTFYRTIKKHLRKPINVICVTYLFHSFILLQFF